MVPDHPGAQLELQCACCISCEIDAAAVLQAGMESGRASVALFINLPDGSIAFVQTSAIQFERIAAIVRGACQSWGEDNR